MNQKSSVTQTPQSVPQVMTSDTKIVTRRVVNTMLAAEHSVRQTVFMLFQNANDLLFAEAEFLHRLSSSSNNRKNSIQEIIRSES